MTTKSCDTQYAIIYVVISLAIMIHVAAFIIN